MSDEFEFTAKLGRIGNHGSPSARSTLDRLRRAASRRRATGAPHRRTGFTGERFGRGAGIGALSKARVFSKARRVVVKVHIARGGASGTAGFAKHVSYIGRDGTERDGSASALYDREHDHVDAEAFNTRGLEDDRQFRIIVSPEDGHELIDMKATTRSLMAEVERDLGESLDWVAADHHNTAHPHTHIVIRGRKGKDALVIAKDYITHGLRARAQEGLTNELGQRREGDIARGQQREAIRDGLTSIDRALAADIVEGKVVLPTALGSGARFDRQLKLSRLRHLESLGLAKPNGLQVWALKPDWQPALKSLGKQGDIVRTLAHQLGSQTKPASILKYEGSDASIWGEVRAIGPGDELRNGRTIILEDINGRLWSFSAGEKEMYDLPTRGGLIALSPAPIKLKPADHVILAVAEANDGIYSDTLHKGMDPASMPEFRLAHKRRLEALRKAGLLNRNSDGSWKIPADYDAKVLAYQSKWQGSDKQVRSWLTLDALVDHPDASFLDRTDLQTHAMDGDFAKRFEAARLARQQWLIENGYLSRNAELLNSEQIARMRAEARNHALRSAAANAKRSPVSLYEKGSFTGTFSGYLDLPQGRFAIIQSSSALTLAPHRKGLGAQQGKLITVTLRAQRLTWQLQRTRGLTR